jgi:hypothetical protein
MTKPDIEQVLDHWLGDGVDVLPDRSVEAVLRTIERTSQRSAWHVPWRTRSVNRNSRLTMMAGMAVIVTFAVGAMLWLGGSSGPAVGGPTPSTAPSTTDDQETGRDTSHELVPDVVVGHWVANRYATDGRPSGRYELTLEPDAATVRRLEGAQPPIVLGQGARGQGWEVIEFEPTSTCEGSGWYRWNLDEGGPPGTTLVLTPIEDACEARRSLLEGRWPAADSEDVPGLFPEEWGDWLEGGRHALTVDGIAFSFDAPAYVFESGWARYGSLYISKDTTRGQAAEAVIYWTGFPDGDYADPCGVLSVPVGPSIDDLASTVSQAPYTKLVSGPSDVIVGGRPAKHVVLTVLEDLSCDPGFFYTWLHQPGGPGWWSTTVGDTISVWIVDVDGTRLFIAGETKEDAGPALEQEVQQIVDSIQFP